MRPPTWYWRLWWRIGYAGPYRWYVSKFHGPVAKLRWLWLRWVLRYRYEVCFSCGRPVGASCPTWWHADDALWERVEGGPGGIRCIPCFTEDCRAAGISVSWKPVVESVVGRWVYPELENGWTTAPPPQAGNLVVMSADGIERVPAGWTYHEGLLWRIVDAGDVLLPSGATRLPYSVEGADFAPVELTEWEAEVAVWRERGGRAFGPPPVPHRDGEQPGADMRA